MIEIACSADERYLPHVSAMLHSLLTHTQQRPLRIWLMHGKELSQEGRDRVAAVTGAFGAQIEFLHVPDKAIEGFPTRKFHYSCWYRILLADLLPQLDRILYLDCDVVVTDDLEPLWSTRLDGKLFAACTNPLFPAMYDTVRETLGIADFSEYLNSGVLLLDLVKMRAEGIAAQLLAYAKEHPDNHCPEQDALSVLYRGRWLSLHPRWNVQTTLYDLKPSRLPYPKTVIKEAVTKPAVVHFNGPFKPWQYLCKHPLKHLYFEHLGQTSWPERPVEMSSLGFRLIRPFSHSTQYRILLYVRPLWLRVKKAVLRVLGRTAPPAKTTGSAG